MTVHVELRQIVNKIIDLEKEHDEIKELIKDDYEAAASSGFDTKIIRKIVAAKRKGAVEALETELTLTGTYLENL